MKIQELRIVEKVNGKLNGVISVKEPVSLTIKSDYGSLLLSREALLKLMKILKAKSRATIVI